MNVNEFRVTLTTKIFEKAETFYHDGVMGK